MGGNGYDVSTWQPGFLCFQLPGKLGGGDLPGGMGDASLDARQQVVPMAREQVMRGQEKQVINLTINSANMMVESFKLLLLPVWLMRFSSAEKTFTILINGQTGIVRDERIENRGEAPLKKILGTD